MSQPILAKYQRSTTNYHVFTIGGVNLYLHKESGVRPKDTEVFTTPGEIPVTGIEPSKTEMVHVHRVEQTVKLVPDINENDRIKKIVMEAVKDVPILVQSHCSCGHTQYRTSKKRK